MKCQINLKHSFTSINSDLYYHKVTIKSRKERKPNQIYLLIS